MTTLAIPVPLRAFAELLRLDQGQVLGRAVLFASVIGFDTVEKHKTNLAAASGVPAERLQEIADAGRHALSITSPVRPEQHLVSKALSGRFCGPTSHGERLLSHNLQFGTAKLRAPRAVGRLTNFVKIDSERTEQLWGLTEQDLPAAINAARTRRVLQNPKHVAVIKDAIALHYARSLDTLDSADRVWQEGLVSARERFLADRPMIEHLYYLKHGFYATGAAVAGLASVPVEIEEAAALDGARPLAAASCTWCSAIRPAVAIATTLGLVNGLRIFDQIMGLTGGGPPAPPRRSRRRSTSRPSRSATSVSVPRSRSS